MPQKKENPRREGVLLEHLNSKLDLVIDGHKTLDKKIDRHHGEFQEFRKEVNYKFDIVFDELNIIKNELKAKVGRDEFLLLEKRVAKLEKAGAHK